ncbi:ABC transporter ATP-binding protein [Microlunatus parietis]|uniref:ATP-binding cassette subfamily B protein n=1 Tax=Microlunatus parietis TaxID=682979 RepID=A0A7Y9I420_9ACTN|nr:ABC transporter ATP-binding protein [Microlunatus parietis]NYE69890.1 ATP-binding cassette subfamily B protein [Microlunatus parietis]
MSSADRGDGPDPDELPPALAAMWRLFRLGYSHEPVLLLVSLGITLLAALPDALLALWLQWLGNAIIARDGMMIMVSVSLMAASVAAGWLLRVLSTRLTRRFRDKVTVGLEAHVATLQASIGGIELHERQEYLDRLAVLRNQVFVLDHMYMSVLGTLGWILRLVVTLGLLVSVHPLLLLLLLFGLPPVFSSSIRPAVERRVEERVARHTRLAEHLFSTATTAAAGKEVRVTGIGPDLVARRRSEWERWFRPVAAARWGTAAAHAVAWAVFGIGYVGAIVFVVLRGSPVGDVLLIMAAGARLSSYIGATVGEIGFLRGTWLDGSRRLVWLERYAASQVSGADLPAPERLDSGIELRGVSFRYPGADRLALDGVSVQLPAGAVIAIVGENGAGKSTLVKLLCGLYRPSAGSVLVDGTDLARIDPDRWRERLAGSFQDFYRFEFLARTSVGLGDLPEVDHEPAVVRAVRRAGAGDVLDRLPYGLDTQLGPTWPDGAEVSFGQWQKLALARGFMRTGPLLTVLDEPTAALDAETEHELFERYAESAAGRSDGGITILVSHRFSTVRMADLILVLDGSRLAEHGSHADLMALGGQYAELYRIQASGYR